MASPKKANEKNISEAYSEPSPTSKMDFIKKITIFRICSIFDVCAEF